MQHTIQSKSMSLHRCLVAFITVAIYLAVELCLLPSSTFAQTQKQFNDFPPPEHFFIQEFSGVPSLRYLEVVKKIGREPIEILAKYFGERKGDYARLRRGAEKRWERYWKQKAQESVALSEARAIDAVTVMNRLQTTDRSPVKKFMIDGRVVEYQKSMYADGEDSLERFDDLHFFVITGAGGSFDPTQYIQNVSDALGEIYANNPEKFIFTYPPTYIWEKREFQPDEWWLAERRQLGHDVPDRFDPIDHLGVYSRETIAAMVANRERFVNQTVVVYGAGNGVLAQAAFALGASRVILLDSDRYGLDEARQLLGKAGKQEGVDYLVGLGDFTGNDLDPFYAQHSVKENTTVAIVPIGPWTGGEDHVGKVVNYGNANEVAMNQIMQEWGEVNFLINSGYSARNHSRQLAAMQGSLRAKGWTIQGQNVEGAEDGPTFLIASRSEVRNAFEFKVVIERQGELARFRIGEQLYIFNAGVLEKILGTDNPELSAIAETAEIRVGGGGEPLYLSQLLRLRGLDDEAQHKLYAIFILHMFRNIFQMKRESVAGNPYGDWKHEYDSFRIEYQPDRVIVSSPDKQIPQPYSTFQVRYSDVALFMSDGTTRLETGPTIENILLFLFLPLVAIDFSKTKEVLQLYEKFFSTPTHTDGDILELTLMLGRLSGQYEDLPPNLNNLEVDISSGVSVKRLALRQPVESAAAFASEINGIGIRTSLHGDNHLRMQLGNKSTNAYFSDPQTLQSSLNYLLGRSEVRNIWSEFIPLGDDVKTDKSLPIFVDHTIGVDLRTISELSPALRSELRKLMEATADSQKVRFYINVRPSDLADSNVETYYVEFMEYARDYDHVHMGFDQRVIARGRMLVLRNEGFESAIAERLQAEFDAKDDVLFPLVYPIGEVEPGRLKAALIVDDLTLQDPTAFDAFITANRSSIEQYLDAYVAISQAA